MNPILLFGQNLAPNNGFDVYSVCPSTSSQIVTPPWTTPVGQTGTPDYMNACFVGGAGAQGVPTNFYGYQIPVSSDGYYGMITHYGGGIEVREYLTAQLTQPLMAGQTYSVGFSVSLSDNFKYATDHFGAYLSVAAPTWSGNYSAMNTYTAQIDNGAGNVISDMAGWTLISGTYTAIGGEQFITIGNFFNDASTQVVTVNASGLQWAYYYMDEAFVIPTNQSLLVSGDTMLCAGESTTLTATGGGPYQWADASNQSVIISTDSFLTVTPNATTSYVVWNTSDTITVTVHVSNPPVFNLGNDTVFCSGSSVLLDATTNGATYLWQDNSINATVSAIVTGLYWCKVTVNGCSAADSVNITVNPIPAINLGNDTTICAGQSLMLNTATAGTTYLWQDNSSGSTFNVTVTGVYWVDVNLNGCVDTDSIQVNVFSSTAPVINSNSPLCEGTSLNLTTGFVAGATYNWSGPGGWSSNLQNPTITNITLAGAGNYSLSISINGCTSPVSNTNVVVNPIPAAPVLGSNSPICEGVDLNLTSNLVAGATINWNGPNGWSSNFQNPTITAASILSAGNYSATITVSGCTSSATNLNVIINQAPSSPVSGSNSTVCEGGDILLTATSVVGATFYWDGPNGWTSNTQNPIITNSLPIHSGNYNVFASLNGCNSSVSTIAVVVVPAAALTFSVSPASICEGEETIISLTSAAFGGAVYSLNSLPGILTSGSGAGPWTVKYLTAGIYDIILSGSIANCTIAPDTRSIVVNPDPVVNFTPQSILYCDSVVVSFINNSTEINSVLWNFGDGSSDTSQTPIHTFFPGNYDVSLSVVSSFGCTTVLNMPSIIIVDSPPVALFTGTPTYGDSIELKNATILFLNQSLNANSFQWNFGDGTSASFISGYHQYNDTGRYFVELIATNNQGCSDTLVLGQWIVMPNILYFIPNAFTPNDDEINDVFKIFGSGIKKSELAVFDRWGEKVFYSNEKEIGWDGTFNNKKLNTGVYVYYAKLILNNGSEILLKGDVSLIR